MSRTANVGGQSFRLDLNGGFVRRTDLSYANLENANLSRADATGALFVGANFKNASLKGTILKGADLTDAVNLTPEQLAEAVIDEETKLPAYLDLIAKLEAS